MSDEQKEILQMVSEGKITADDGVKLLTALEEGERKRRDHHSPAKRMKQQKKMVLESMRSHGMGLENMREIGNMVKNIVSDAVSGISENYSTESFNIDKDRFKDFGILDGELELDEGTELFISNSRFSSGADLTLQGVDGSCCAVIGGDEPEVSVFRDDGSVWLKWDNGDLTLSIPETVGKLSTSIMGGDIVIGGVKTPVNVKTKGGDISILEASHGFNAKTMGGDIIISLTDLWNEDSTVVTMGGDINVGLSKDTKAVISAKTFGGEINVQDGIGKVDKSGQIGTSRVRVYLSGDEDAPDMKLKTMGGDISIGDLDINEEEIPEEEGR
jgi:DUF4097 and DUF4098 domain-containing protein YvlB